MSITRRHARVTGPVQYIAGNGEAVSVPIGPCAIEQLEGQLVEVIWGPAGGQSAVFQMKQLEAAEINGHWVWLD